MKNKQLIKLFLRGRWLRLASKYVAHPKKLYELLCSIYSYIDKNGLKEVSSQLSFIWYYIGDVISGTYKDYSKSDLLLMVAGLIYLITPIDMFPDIFPSGFVDDVGILLYVINTVKGELDRYARYCDSLKTETDDTQDKIEM